MKVFCLLLGAIVLLLCSPTLTLADDPAFGACCIDDTCFVTTWEVCANLEGGYQGNWTECYLGIACNCCEGIAGNVDADPLDLINISDLTSLVTLLFVGDVPFCELEENVDGVLRNGVIPTDILDLVFLVEYLFAGGPAPPPCP